MKFIIEIISTIFFIGYLPAGGTFATIVSLPLVVWVDKQNIIFQIFFVFIFTCFSIFISALAEEKVFQKKDDRRIVIDEMLGFLIAILGIDIKSFSLLFLGFIIFRILDIYKLGIKKIQNLPSGFGIVADDFLCGIITNIILRILLLCL